MPRMATPLRSVDATEIEENQYCNSVTENKFTESQKIIPFSSSDNLEEIKKRFLGNEESESEKNLKVFFTKDKNLLSQYYSLRDRCFKEDSGWDEYDGSEVEADIRGRLLIVTNGEGKVVGGMRVLFPCFDEYSASDYAEDGLTIKNFLQKSGLNSEARYSEISAVAVEKEHRGISLMKKMFSIVIQKSLESQCSYVVGVGILAACRYYRVIFKGLGYVLDIGSDFEWIGRKTKKGYAPRFPMVVHLKGKIGIT